MRLSTMQKNERGARRITIGRVGSFLVGSVVTAVVVVLFLRNPHARLVYVETVVVEEGGRMMWAGENDAKGDCAYWTPVWDGRGGWRGSTARALPHGEFEVFTQPEDSAMTFFSVICEGADSVRYEIAAEYMPGDVGGEVAVFEHVAIQWWREWLGQQVINEFLPKLEAVVESTLRDFELDDGYTITKADVDIEFAGATSSSFFVGYFGLDVDGPAGIDCEVRGTIRDGGLMRERMRGRARPGGIPSPHEMRLVTQIPTVSFVGDAQPSAAAAAGGGFFGAIIGAVVGGPIGALVGGGFGASAGSISSAAWDPVTCAIAGHFKEADVTRKINVSVAEWVTEEFHVPEEFVR